MPKIKVILYKSQDGLIPVLEWLNSLPEKVVSKCLMRINRLHELGFEIRRPEADYL